VAGTIRNWLSSDARRLERLRAGGGFVMVGLGIITFANSLLNS